MKRTVLRKAGVGLGWEDLPEAGCCSQPRNQTDSCSLGVCPFPGSQPNQGAGLARELPALSGRPVHAHARTASRPFGQAQAPPSDWKVQLLFH